MDPGACNYLDALIALKISSVLLSAWLQFKETTAQIAEVIQPNIFI